MPSEPRSDAPAQRLHPSSLLFGIGSLARNLILPGLVFWAASRSMGYQVWMKGRFTPAQLEKIKHPNINRLLLIWYI